MAEQEKDTVVTFPVGRMINGSLFVKDAFNDKSTPSYKVEVAYDYDDLADVEGAMLDFADDKWGKGSGDDESLVLPFKDGDKMAKKRERDGKEGDAYKGKIVVRSNTIFNADGQDAPGGVWVVDEDNEQVTPANANAIYNGCEVIVVATLSGYVDDDGNNAVKFYLSGVQKVGAGERLSSGTDKSKLFKPVGREAEGGTEGKRRRRAG